LTYDVLTVKPTMLMQSELEIGIPIAETFARSSEGVDEMKPARCLTIFLSLFFLGFQLFPWSKAEGADFYVDGSNGDDSRDGLSWAAAKKTVSAAVSAASATGEMDTIRVAAGTYVENLVVTEPEVLLGGYPVGGGDRDWEANPTILDGAHLDTVVMIQGNGFGTVVDGFTITNGYSVWGGGIAIWGLTFPGDTPETLIQNLCEDSHLPNPE
jgi:hypothetical protein